MEENSAINNTSRLSMALEDLPLTPIGMKSPSCITQKKKYGKYDEKYNALSLRRLKPLQEGQPVLTTPPEQPPKKEEFILPKNRQNVNLRRLKNKSRGKGHNARNMDKNLGTILPPESINCVPTHHASPIENERRDSIFTDIDDGSFIEFTQSSSECLPYLSKDVFPQFYYTCTDNNETKYSTSSKTPLAPVGFHKFLSVVQNKVLSKISEEVSSKEDPNDLRNNFKLDESVIAGSQDVLGLKNQRKLSRILNSTEYSFTHPNIYEIPDISTLTIHNSYDKQGKSNTNLCKPANHTDSYECIVLSESEDDKEDDVNKIPTKDPQQLSLNQSNHNKKDGLSESLFTEDLSVLFLPENKGHKKVCDSQNKMDRCYGSLPNNNKDVQEGKEGRSEEVICISDVDERVVGWVMNSPFKDGSFGSSFMNDKAESPDFIVNNKAVELNDNNCYTKKSLSLALSEDECHTKSSGKTVFTLEKVAELQTKGNFVEFVQPFALTAELGPINSENSINKTHSNNELNSSLITEDNTTLSFIPDCQYNVDDHDSKCAYNIQTNIATENTEFDEQFCKYSSNECSRECLISSRNCVEEKQNLPSAIIYESDSSEEKEERDCNLLTSSGNELHLNLTSSSNNSNHFKVNKEDLVRKMANLQGRSNKDSIIGSEKNKIQLDKKLKSQNSSKDSLPLPFSRNDSKNLAKSFSDASLHLHLTNDGTDSRNFSPKITPNLTNEKKSSHLELHNNSDRKQNSFHKRKSILKSNSSSHINSIHHISLDDLSSNESLPDLDTSKNLRKSHSVKQLTHCSSNSESEDSFQKLKKDFNKVYENSWRKDKVSKSKTVRKPIVEKTFLSQISQSVANDRRKPLLEKKNSIPELCLTASDSSESNFEDYIKSTKQKTRMIQQQKIHRQNSSFDFIVSDSEIEYLSSPLAEKPFKNSTVNLYEKGISGKKTFSDSSNKWKNYQKIISSSDSEDESYRLPKTGKISKHKVPKQKSPLIKNTQRLFLSSSTSDSDEENPVFPKTKKVLVTKTSKQTPALVRNTQKIIISDSGSGSDEENPVISKGLNVLKSKTSKQHPTSTKNTQRIILSASSSDSDKENTVFPKGKVFKPKTPKQKPALIKNTPRRISLFSSDSDEENPVFPKSKKVLEPKTPKQKPVSVTKTSNARNSPISLSFLASLTSGTPLSTAHIDAIPFLKNFKKQKDSLTQKLYLLFNETVFNNKLPSSMKITWNSRMTKTAGFCYYQMDKSKPSGRGARIELSVKVIDAPGRLRDTLIHELCHAASWIISGYKDGHGPLWKSWANKAMRAYPELPFISRCHSYEVNCKYTYKCSNCGYSIGRHSKSLNIEKKVCGYCYGKFELLVNYNRKGSSTEDKSVSNLTKGTPKTPRTPGAFALYVKHNYGSIKSTQKSLKHKDIMKALSEEFAKLKTQT